MIPARAWIVPIAAGLILITVGAKARADEPNLPNGFTCEDVRRTVQEIGKVRAIALALENGATWAQIREASRCLRR
jgi:hypothetical protein